jgi:hypothetical protein
MECPACGAENPAQAPSCHNCQAPLPSPPFRRQPAAFGRPLDLNNARKYTAATGTLTRPRCTGDTQTPLGEST